jgi:hypothetical protein
LATKIVNPYFAYFLLKQPTLMEQPMLLQYLQNLNKYLMGPGVRWHKIISSKSSPAIKETTE